MLSVVRTKAKRGRSLQQSNLKTKAECEHCEVLGKLIQAGSELQQLQIQAAPECWDSEKGTIRNHCKQTMSTWKHQSLNIHFDVGMGTNALTERLSSHSQVAGWTSVCWCIPTTGSLGEFSKGSFLVRLSKPLHRDLEMQIFLFFWSSCVTFVLKSNCVRPLCLTITFI